MMTNGEKFKSVFGFGADGSRVIAVNATWWDCAFQNRKPITNADHIRSMTDEELAEFCFCITDDVASYYDDDGYKPKYPAASKDWLDWLKQEAEEGE